jgi:hypothetical protein
VSRTGFAVIWCRRRSIAVNGGSGSNHRIAKSRAERTRYPKETENLAQL